MEIKEQRYGPGASKNTAIERRTERWRVSAAGGYQPHYRTYEFFECTDFPAMSGEEIAEEGVGAYSANMISNAPLCFNTLARSGKN